MMASPFAGMVCAGLKRRGVTLRQLCRTVSLDPSFFSKVLSGKRSPPMEEEVLRRIAAELEIGAAELIVSAGRIPSEWSALWRDRELFARMNSLAQEGAQLRFAPPLPAAPPRPARQAPPRHQVFRAPLSEELL